MNPLDQFTSVALKRIRIMATLMLVVVPVIYLAVANLVEVIPHEGGEVDMMFYILMIIAVAEPSVLPLIERVQVSKMRRPSSGKVHPAQLAFTIWLTKIAMVEAIYIFGLVVYFLSGDLTNFLLFYLFGIIWSFVYWPNDTKLRTLLEKLEVA